MFVFQLVNNCFVNWKSKGPYSALLQKKTKLLQNLFRCLYYLGDLLSFKFFSSVYKILNTSGCLNHFSIKNIYCFFLPTSLRGHLKATYRVEEQNFCKARKVIKWLQHRPKPLETNFVGYVRACLTPVFPSHTPSCAPRQHPRCANRTSGYIS